MSNSVTDDYFAFMSNKSSKLPMPGPVKFDPPKKAATGVDTVDFVDDTQIEVTESLISDTMIQRIFRPQKV